MHRALIAGRAWFAKGISGPSWRRIRAPPLRSADFQVGCIADFQIREPGIVQVALEFWCVADLEIGDTAGLETCATRTHQIDPPGTNNFCASRKVVFVSSSVQERLNTQSTPCCKSGSLNRVIFWPHRSQATTMLR